MTLRLMSRPTSSWRKPVSIGCWIRTRTSTTSPRFACRGIWIRAAIVLALVQAGGEGDDDRRGVGPERAVGELRDRGHALASREAYARVDLGLACARAEVEARHVRHRVAVGVQVDALHVIARRHGAVDGDPYRDGVAVVGELRQLERHLAFPHRGAVGDDPDGRTERILLRERGAGRDERSGETCEKFAALHRGSFSVAR